LSALLDVNFLLALAWETHDAHDTANDWLHSQKTFSTCPITQMGFLRVSMSPGFGASFADAMASLDGLTQLKKHRFVIDETRAADLTAVTSSKEVTDAHLVRISSANKLKLATLDQKLCGKVWAVGVAYDPLGA